MSRRNIIEDCKINENKLIVNKKDYLFIPIQNNPIFQYYEEKIKIETKYYKKLPVLIINNSQAWKEEQFKELFKRTIN